MWTRLVLFLLVTATLDAATPRELLDLIEKRAKGPERVANFQRGFSGLVAEHPASPELERVAVRLLFFAPAISLPLAEQALAAKLSRNAEGLVRYARVRQLLDEYNNVPPSARAARVEQVRKEATDVVARFGDVKLFDDTLKKVAERIVYEVDHLMPGQPAPAAAGVDLDGKPLSLASFRGKVVALSFWGAWCPPCVAALPGERQFVDSMKDKPFALIGVNSDPDVDKALAVAAKNGVTWPSFKDGAQDGPICTAYAISAFPAVYVIDKKGIIRHRALPPDEEMLKEAVTPLLGEP